MFDEEVEIGRFFTLTSVPCDDGLIVDLDERPKMSAMPNLWLLEVTAGVAVKFKDLFNANGGVCLFVFGDEDVDDVGDDDELVSGDEVDDENELLSEFCDWGKNVVPCPGVG